MEGLNKSFKEGDDCLFAMPNIIMIFLICTSLQLEKIDLMAGASPV